MAKTAAPESRNLRKGKISGATASTNQAKSKIRSRTMNGHIKNEEPMNGHVKDEEPEDLVVPSSSTETCNGDGGESSEEVEEGGGGENGKIASEEDEEEVLVEKINGYIRKGQKEEVKNQGKRKKRINGEVEAEGKIEDALYKFPMNRVSRIIRSEISNVRLSQEAVFVINKASEKFLELFSREAYACAFLDRKSHIAYDHLSSVVSKRKRFNFVSDFIPERVKAEDAIAQMSESEK